MKHPRRTDRVATALQAMIVVNVAFIYATAARAPQTFLIAAAGSMIAVVIGRKLQPTTRGLVYGGVAVLVVAAAESQFLPSRDTRFLLAQTTVYCPILIYAGTGLLFFRQERIIPPVLTSVGLLVLLLAGSTLGAPMPGDASSWQGVLAGHFKLVYRMAALVQIVGMVALFQRSPVKRRETHSQSPALRWALTGACLAAVLLCSAWLERVATRLEPSMTRWYSKLMAMYLDRRPQGVMFDVETDLWQTVPPRTRGDRKVVFRVVSPSQPGYMRGRVYDHYRRGRWMGADKGRALPAWMAEGFRAYTVFQRPIPERSRQNEVLSIHPAVVLETDILFAPGTGTRFEIVAESLASDRAGMLTHTKWDQKAGYRVIRPQHAGAAYPLPGPETAENEDWLAVPERLAEDLDRISAEALAGGITDDGETISRVVAFLRDRCSYALGVKMQRARGDEAVVDPVIQFLDIHRAGHCELFATAAVLLLRQQGTPARYVTGFVCAEPVARHWVARMEHAHAWAEAYDSQSGEWVLVEATPAAGMPSRDTRATALSAFLERLNLAWQRFMARVRRGELADAIASFVAAVFKATVWLAKQWWSWAVGVIVIISGALYTKSVPGQRAPQDSHLAIMQRMLRQAERSLARRGVSARRETETLRDFNGRVARADAELGLKLWSLLAEFERLRYDPGARSLEAVESLKTKWRELAGEIKRSASGFSVK